MTWGAFHRLFVLVLPQFCWRCFAVSVVLWSCLSLLFKRRGIFSVMLLFWFLDDPLLDELFLRLSAGLICR